MMTEAEQYRVAGMLGAAAMRRYERRKMFPNVVVVLAFVIPWSFGVGSLIGWLIEALR